MPTPSAMAVCRPIEAIAKPIAAPKTPSSTTRAQASRNEPISAALKSPTEPAIEAMPRNAPVQTTR